MSFSVVRSRFLLGRELLAQKLLRLRRLSIPFCELLRRQEADQALPNRRPVVGYFLDQILLGDTGVLLFVFLHFVVGLDRKSVV